MEFPVMVFANTGRLGKKAKLLTDHEYAQLIQFVSEEKGNHQQRDLVAVQLTFLAGLRPCEIAGLKWGSHVCTATGEIAEVLTLTSDISKKAHGREIPIHPELRRALVALRALCPEHRYVFYPTNVTDGCNDRNSPPAVSKFFARMYARLSYIGCSAYSGRRTWITIRARQCGTVGCSLLDVARMAGHSSLATTAGYIEPAPNVQLLAEMPLYRAQVQRSYADGLYLAAPRPHGTMPPNLPRA
jgi:integrase/recombinase XerC